MLKATPRAKGGQPFQKSTGAKTEPVEDTLADLGLDKKTSAIAQKLADELSNPAEVGVNEIAWPGPDPYKVEIPSR